MNTFSRILAQFLLNLKFLPRGGIFVFLEQKNGPHMGTVSGPGRWCLTVVGEGKEAGWRAGESGAATVSRLKRIAEIALRWRGFEKEKIETLASGISWASSRAWLFGSPGLLNGTAGERTIRWFSTVA